MSVPVEPRSKSRLAASPLRAPTLGTPKKFSITTASPGKFCAGMMADIAKLSSPVKNAFTNVQPIAAQTITAQSPSRMPPSATAPSMSAQSTTVQTMSVQSTAVQSSETKKNYGCSAERMAELLSDGYFRVPKQYWEYLAPGAHIRYTKKGEGAEHDRFRTGGYVQKHIDTEHGEHMIMIETIVGGKRGDVGYLLYPVIHTEFDKIWKKYPRDVYIELSLMANSLNAKNKTIADLTERVSKLEKILISAIR